MEDNTLFKKLLGIRELIKSASELDQLIIHYITYNYATNLFELTVAAQSTTALTLIWTFKLNLPHTILERVLILIKKMINHYDKKYMKEVENG